MYELTFFEAIERCARGEGFIRGEKFRAGVYVKKLGDNLIAVDAFNSNKSLGNFFISTGIMTQKYKLFENAVEEELQSENNNLVYLHNKAT